MSRIIVDSIRNSSASSDGITLSSDGKVAFPNTSTGKILQVVQTHYSDRISNTTGSGAEWAPSQLNCTITPAATSSKVLITAKVAIGFNVNTRSCLLYTSPSPRDS